MSDRVTSLRYRFENRNEHDHFENAAGHETVLGNFEVTLRDGQLEATPLGDYQQVRDAREALEPLLRAWEIAAQLDGHDVAFVFEAGGIESATSAGHEAFRVELTETVGIGADAVIARFNGDYPHPDLDLRSGPVVEQMLTRLRDSRSDERLLVMNANWMVTRIEEEYGQAKGGSDKRKAAARELNLDAAILGSMATLAIRNDPALGRKARGAVQPLTPDEIAWLREGMTAVVRQVARYHSGAHRTRQITMADLPALP